MLFHILIAIFHLFIFAAIGALFVEQRTLHEKALRDVHNYYLMKDQT